jgi:hypothetical protein
MNIRRGEDFEFPPDLTSPGGMAGAPGETGALKPRTARELLDDRPKGGGGAPVPSSGSSFTP